jgi:hypothetical protein
MTLQAARNYPVNCGTPTTDFAGRRFAKASLTERSFRIDATAIARQVTESSTGTQTFKDKVYATVASATFVTDYSIQITDIETNYSFRGSIAETTGRLLLAPNGPAYAATADSIGVARIVATDFQGQSLIRSLPVSELSNATQFTFLNYASGSLAEHTTGLLSRLSSPPTIQVFSTQTPATQAYIRNPACWVSDLDFTAKGVWNSAGGFGMGGCLLTPRHAVFTEHLGYFPNVGTVIHFVGRDAAAGQPEQVAVRTVSHISALDSITGDQKLVRLSEPVPAFITPAKVLPPDFASAKMPMEQRVSPTNITNDGDGATAALWIDRFNNARLRLPIVTDEAWLHFWRQFYQPFWPYAPVAQRGDSGTPVFLVINNQCVYVGNHSTTSTGTVLVRDQQGPLKNIRDQITAWGDNDVIETVDLTAFPTY